MLKKILDKPFTVRTYCKLCGAVIGIYALGTAIAVVVNKVKSKRPKHKDDFDDLEFV